VPLGDALFVGVGVPVDAEALGLGEEVGAVEDWVGIGVGGPSSEQPARVSARRDSTATVLTVVVRDLRMATLLRVRWLLRSTVLAGARSHGTARPGASVRTRRPSATASGILGGMNIGLRDRVLPENQRRTLDELSDDLDLRSGDTRAKQSAFWTMLVLSGIIATAGVLADSTATVIGAMIIAPLSTPIMGIALGIVKRERIRAGRFVLLGAIVVVLIGAIAAFVVPDIDVQTNAQITSRTSPTVIDLIAAIATGVAGAVGLARRDVAAVLPGVAIAISLVPPLAVVGICLGEGSVSLALGALLLFVSNLVSMVIAGTVIFAALGYSADADAEARAIGAQRKSYVTLVALLVAVLVPLALNTGLVLLLHSWTGQIQTVAESWLSGIPEAEVTDVTFTSSSFRIEVRVPPGDLPPTDELLRQLDGTVPDGLAIVVDTTYGEEIDVGTTGSTGAA
jgi:uncharacterized hydrophobic protein (TIGR00271 family)